MELQEALSNLEKLEESLKTIRLNTINVESYKRRIRQLEENKVEYQKDLTNHRENHYKYKRYFDLVKEKSTVTICDECDGAGGFDWEAGPGDCGCEPCKKCATTGIIDKE